MQGLHLTPGILAAAYNYLKETLPFRRWSLPDSDSLKFQVIRSKKVLGICIERPSGTTIQISSANIGETGSLMRTMAHEMIHVHLNILGVKSHHGKKFRRLAAGVCKHHGFDAKLF